MFENISCKKPMFKVEIGLFILLKSLKIIFEIDSKVIESRRLTNTTHY